MAETSKLTANIESQLTRLLTQLQDVEEMKDELDDDEYEEERADTMAQLAEFEASLAAMQQGDMVLSTAIERAQLRIRDATGAQSAQGLFTLLLLLCLTLLCDRVRMCVCERVCVCEKRRGVIAVGFLLLIGCVGLAAFMSTNSPKGGTSRWRRRERGRERERERERRPGIFLCALY